MKIWVERLRKSRNFPRGPFPPGSCAEETRPIQTLTMSVIHAEEPARIEMDKAGYFVIIPQPKKGLITVEHYSYDNNLLRAIEGRMPVAYT